MARLLAALTVAAVTTTAANPTLDINLDAVPEARWGNVSKYFTKEIRPMFDHWTEVLERSFTPLERLDWITTIKLTSAEFATYVRELVGIIGWFMTPEDDPQQLLDQLILFNAIYELGSPDARVGGCSGIVMADSNGRVFHGRNMDYVFQFRMPDGRILDLPDVTFTARYWKDGKVLMVAPSFLLFVGVHTGMRMDGWTVEQNTRNPNDWHKNLQALKDAKGDLFGWRVRQVMETTPTYQGALTTLVNAEFIAPMYFIMSGKGRYEGAVVTKDRGDEHLADTEAVRQLSEANGTWYLLQTNDDVNKLPEDSRRPASKLMLASVNQTQVDQALVWKLIRSQTLVVPETVFTWVADSSTGYSEVITRNEADAASHFQLAAAPAGGPKRVAGQKIGHTKWARKALLASESGFF
mmetsp:Transcript_95437/g.227325  ORF Transcript_95437/g.227325 Transcript_95437/m.227325 type:complete len:410 (+) Transcript_95437:70-1299(+)